MVEEVTAWEILELADGESKTLRIKKWELRRDKIIPTGAVEPKEINVLRVWVPEEDKPIGPNYWDITGQTLITQLLPYLRWEDFYRYKYTITAYGVAPRKRFTLKVEPL